MIQRVKIQPSSGVAYVQDAALAFVHPILVTLEGLQTDISTSVGNRRCRYSASEGRFYFENDFDGTQIVNIKYKATLT